LRSTFEPFFVSFFYRVLQFLRRLRLNCFLCRLYGACLGDATNFFPHFSGSIQFLCHFGPYFFFFSDSIILWL